jgi:hypothetical protein
MTRDEFFAEVESSPRKEKFTLPSGKVVWVEEPTARELLEARLESSRAAQGNEDKSDALFPARLAARCVTDGNGKQIFTVKDAERIMGGKSRIITALTDLVFEVAGLTDDAKKNSASAEISTSPTASPGSAESGTLAVCSAA